MVQPDLFGRFGRMSVREAARIIAAALAILTPVWAFGGDFITKHVDDALVETLKRKGMGPGDIQAMKDQLRAMGVDIDEVHKGTDQLNKEVEDIQRLLSAVDSNQRQTHDLLKALIPLMKAEMERGQ